jgi:acyl carrier protein
MMGADRWLPGIKNLGSFKRGNYWQRKRLVCGLTQVCSAAYCTTFFEVSMQEAEVREKLREFIVHDLIRDDEYELEDDEGIITGGLMDSFALAEFGVYVEQEFNVYIPDADLTVAKMDTLDQMVVRVMSG